MNPTQTSDWNQLWDAYAASAEENPAQKYRRLQIEKLLNLKNAPRPLRILDLGSGQGDFSQEIKAKYPEAEVVGIELSERGVKESQRKVPGARFFQADLTQPLNLPEELKGWATHAVCSEILEHIENPIRVLENVKPLLSTDCRWVITVPSGPRSYFDRHIGHLQHFSASEFKALCIKAGYEFESLSKAGFPFFNLYKLVLILRGKKLVSDVEVPQSQSLSWSVRTAMAIFDWLFQFNLDNFFGGWQIAAVVKKKPLN